jgi:hypothetical protein
MPGAVKTFRVFVSSTFTDMRAERRILQEQVFPRLKALCERKGASFQDVDLRWGVNEEAQLDQKTMDICRGEIARCQRLSPKPNFIILLGDKYGWQPVPDRIPSIEMEDIKTQLSEEDKKLVNIWYYEDLNAVPPEYVLQPRGDEYRVYENWQKVEDSLRDILREAVARLPFTQEQRVKYFASATHQEIIRGALNPPPGAIGPEEHVFAYFRTIEGLPENGEAKDFADVSDGGRDVYSRDRLEQLKCDLKAKLPPDHVYQYQAEWKDGGILHDARALGVRVLADLSSVIERQLEGMGESDPLREEIKKHEEFKQQRLEHFTGQEEALQAINDYLEGPVNKVLAIIGASGTGKTSLMAKAIEKAGNRKGVKVLRFVGTTSATSDAYKLLFGIINEIATTYGVEMQDLLKKGEDETRFSTLRGLTEILPRCLGIANGKRPLVIFLDALDQLTREYASLFFDWLPRILPKHVKIVVSALPDLAQKLSHAAIYELGGMGMGDGKELLRKWMAGANRTLQGQQEEEVLNKFQRNGTPLYLRLAFEQARTWPSYGGSPALSAEIGGGIERILRRSGEDSRQSFPVEGVRLSFERQISGTH